MIYFNYLIKIILVQLSNKNTTFMSFAGTCNLNSSGRGCAAWVIENGNMDYLHCDDLSWDGKRKCDD